MMSFRWLLLTTPLVLFVCYFVDNLIKVGFWHRNFDHFPGNCVKFEGIDGSEDFVLMPNDHVLISSGYTFWPLDDEFPPHKSGVYMIDLGMPNITQSKLVNLTFEGSYRLSNSPDFTPHGMSHWITEDGEMLLYIINHRRRGDTVDSFVYNPGKKSLKFLKSFENLLLYNLNNLVVVGPDQFYVTVDNYCTSIPGRYAENLLRLPLGKVLYVDGKDSEKTVTKLAMDGLKYPNGIAQSNDHRFVFVNELSEGTVNVYMRNGDNTLTLVQKLPIHIGLDNIVVSPENGHLWVAHFVNGLQFFKYIYNHSEPMPGKIMHIAINQDADLPFTDCKIEEVLSTTGEKINAVTTGLYHRGKLLLGTIRKDMWMCDVHYLMH